MFVHQKKKKIRKKRTAVLQEFRIPERDVFLFQVCIIIFKKKKKNELMEFLSTIFCTGGNLLK